MQMTQRLEALMETATLTAIANGLAKAAKASRSDLTVGEHRVAGTITLDYSGVVKVGESEEYTPTTAIPFKTALALVLHHAGVTGPAAAKALTAAMIEAVELDRLDKTEHATKVEAIRAIADLKKAESVVQSAVEALPKAQRAGKVRVLELRIKEAGGAEIVS